MPVYFEAAINSTVITLFRIAKVFHAFHIHLLSIEMIHIFLSHFLITIILHVCLIYLLNILLLIKCVIIFYRSSENLLLIFD